MKGFAVIFLAIIAVIRGLPQPKTEIDTREARFVDGIVASVLEDVSEQIREAGLDPWSFDKFAAAYELPVPVLFSASAYVEDILFTGLSDIVINHINYGLLNFRLTLDISLPEIAISIGGAGFDVTALGSKFEGHIDGRFALIEPRISGVIQINIGIISGVFVRDIDLEFDLEAIRFNGNVNLLGMDLTGFVTDFSTKRIPTAIREHRSEINELVEIIAWEVVGLIL